MAEGGQAQKLRAERGGRSAAGGQPWRDGRDSERGQREKAEEMERDEKQGTYFPVYPNLRDAKSLKTGEGGKQREKEGK